MASTPLLLPTDDNRSPTTAPAAASHSGTVTVFAVCHVTLPPPSANVPPHPRPHRRSRTGSRHSGNDRRQSITPADAATMPASCHVTPAWLVAPPPPVLVPLRSDTRCCLPTCPRNPHDPTQCNQWRRRSAVIHTAIAMAATSLWQHLPSTTSGTHPTVFGRAWLPPHMATEPTRPNTMQPMAPALCRRPHSHSDSCHVTVAAPAIRTFRRVHARAIALAQVHSGTPADAATAPAAYHGTPAWRTKTKPPRQLNALRPHLRAAGCAYLSRQPLTLRLPPHALVPSSFCTALPHAAMLPPPMLVGRVTRLCRHPFHHSAPRHLATPLRRSSCAVSPIGLPPPRPPVPVPLCPACAVALVRR
jgi:hypothetical protein